MIKTIPFHKMVASGNDFIVVDNRKKLIKNPRQFAGRVCPVHSGIGADGVLLIEPAPKNVRAAKFTMRIINSDGSEAEACGNGFRCIALYANRFLKTGAEFTFQSLAGTIGARVSNSKIRVELVKPTQFKNRSPIEVLSHRLHYYFLNTGVPHAVILVQGLDQIDVASLGRVIRFHEKFQPKGTNVNFVEIDSPSQIRVRTYERGVEAETLACGTGSTASAIVSAIAGYVKPPVRVTTRGGEVLTIHFERQGEDVRKVALEGQAQFVYEGKYSL